MLTIIFLFFLALSIWGSDCLINMQKEILRLLGIMLGLYGSSIFFSFAFASAVSLSLWINMLIGGTMILIGAILKWKCPNTDLIYKLSMLFGCAWTIGCILVKGLV